jgi:DNA-directed RNA polymerase subunit RPC12/RpoP
VLVAVDGERHADLYSDPVDLGTQSNLIGAPGPVRVGPIPADQTGAIMFVCAGSDKHEDKEVLINKCPSCSEQNYFYWESANSQFVCFACTKAVDNAVVKCPDCGRPPHKVHTRPTGK